jgi:hypothetical protein
MTKRAVLLKALASMPSDLGRVLKGVDAAEARRRPTPGERSIIDLLKRLVEAEAYFLGQIRDVVCEERPSLPALRHDEARDDLDMSLDALIERVKMARAETLAFLEGLSPGDWQRKAVHETWGETRLRFLVQHLVDHDTQCLSQLAGTRQRLRAPAALDRAPFLDPAPSVSYGDVRSRPPGGDLNLDSEEKNERRTRNWPRKRRRGN